MKFNYQARDVKGQTQIGQVEASSQDAALEVLSRSGFYVTLLEEAAKKPVYAKRVSFFEKVSVKEVMLFSRQLAIMFKSQVSLLEALRTLALQTKNQSFKEKILDMAEEVEAGTPLSQALSSHAAVFSPFYISMVKSGEASGTLSKSLEYLASHLQREYELTSRVRGALVYPAFVVAVAFLVLFLMMFFVIPNMTKVLEGLGQELPFLTKVVLSLTDFLRSKWWLLLLALGSAATFLVRYTKTLEGKRFLNSAFLSLPLLGPVLSMVYLARFAENLSTLVAGGIPIVQALDITGNVLGNDVYRTIIHEARDEVKNGKNISEVLQRHTKEFPPIFTQMVFVGEKSGTLDTSLLNIVEFYQKEVARTVDSFLSLIEPLLIVVLGLMVGGLMAAVLLPLYQISAF
jgi:type IV pilus assembly protein PilC